MPITARMWLPVLALLADGLTIGAANAAPYSVEGFVLGDRISATNSNYRTYTCKQSDDLDEAVSCERTEVKSGRAGNITVSSTLIHTRDGTAIYIMANAFPVSLTKAIVQNEIATLSTEINEKPAKVEWLPKDAPAPAAVVVTWGQVELEEIDDRAVFDISQGKRLDLGPLINSVGNLKRSAQDHLPIYRIRGGAGYVYSASSAPPRAGIDITWPPTVLSFSRECSPSQYLMSLSGTSHWLRMTSTFGPKWPS